MAPQSHLGGEVDMTIEEVQRHLPDLLSRLRPGEVLVIDEEGEPVATLTRTERTEWPCQPGSARDAHHWMATDFDAPLDDFREYTE